LDGPGAVRVAEREAAGGEFAGEAEGARGEETQAGLIGGGGEDRR